VTVVGVPLALAGAVAFALLLWVLFVVAVPLAGGVVRFLVLPVGLGAFVLAARGARSGEGGVVFDADEDESAAG
jgi:hypothetical protein